MIKSGLSALCAIELSIVFTKGKRYSAISISLSGKQCKNKQRNTAHKKITS